MINRKETINRKEMISRKEMTETKVMITKVKVIMVNPMTMEKVKGKTGNLN